MTQKPLSQGLYDTSTEHDSCGVGFIAHINGQKSHDIVERGLKILGNLVHRGATGADPETGDGAGATFQIPHKFFKSKVSNLPEAGEYGVGMVFLPKNSPEMVDTVALINRHLEQEGLEVIAWREVLVNSECIGKTAKTSEPAIKQVFIKRPASLDLMAFERRLFVVRKLIEVDYRNLHGENDSRFHFSSLSARTIVYKGLLLPEQVTHYFLDLHDPQFESALALVHSRFSTNTFPTWDLAQPLRLLAHNGEINTIKGNIFWMQARESLLKSDLIGPDLSRILPIIEPNKSDSFTFDNVLELLVLAGRSIPHALMMMIPESWNDKNPISDTRKAFYEYHASFMEPWDGPATMAVTDGEVIGATLDRNGLRPARYVITKDDFIVMASETGVECIEAEEIQHKGRLSPGKMLLVDIKEGRVIPDGEIKHQIANAKPYRQWVESNRIWLKDIKTAKKAPKTHSDKDLAFLHQVYGYDIEEANTLIAPMCLQGKEAVGSMGCDTPLAILSKKPQRLYSYFKQLFAQVTNPAIDPIREVLVMSLTSFIGSRKNLLSESAEHCKSIRFVNPIWTDEDIEKIKSLTDPAFSSATIDITFPRDQGEAGLKLSLDRIFNEADRLVKSGTTFLILSDRNASRTNVPIPALLVTSGLHHHLVRQKTRTQASILVETGEARDVVHFALLFGYGADAVNPYLAFETIRYLIEKQLLSGINYVDAVHNYVKAIDAGLLKVLSKMGISTLRSYRGAQLYEAVGLSSDLVKEYFTGTTSRLGGIGINEVAKETFLFFDSAVEHDGVEMSALPPIGNYKFRKDGEFHGWNPETVRFLQRAAKENNAEMYGKFSEIANKQTKELGMLRGLLDFVPGKAISIDEVESAEDIVSRFTTGAMSYGALSREAHETLAVAMNHLGGRSNSGEGGEESERFVTRPDGSSARSAIKQVASGRFGVTTHYLVNADELQIKVAQGAKPGEGGQLPGHKVDKAIAAVRHATPGVSLISPPPHHDIYSIEDLAQLIFDLKNVNPSANISVKLVSEVGVGTVAAGVAKAYSDLITVSGYDGGTGASPISSIKHAGLPWELGISEAHQTLVLNDLRGRVRLQVDGGLKTGRDVVIGAMLGAEEFGFSTAALISIGCAMIRVCHLNTCPTGVATQDPELRKKFKGLPEHVIHYLLFVAGEVRSILASLGIRKIADIVGRTDYLKFVPDPERWKTEFLNFDQILYQPQVPESVAKQKVQEQQHRIKDVLDLKLIELSKEALDGQSDVCEKVTIRNFNRSTGAMLSGVIAKKYGAFGLSNHSIDIEFSGSAGQSFGAFLTKGVSFKLLGDANDYVGKGLSGGRIVVRPELNATFKPEKNVIIGNTSFYGATAGEGFINGLAGERFAIRNSGATLVVEGTGDHCCEYMTGGRVIVLGEVGRNFGAGMSGGIAYVYDPKGDFEFYCNTEMVELSGISEESDEIILKETIQRHADLTGSHAAIAILDNWKVALDAFVKVLPIEYKAYLLANKDIEVVEADRADG